MAFRCPLAFLNLEADGVPGAFVAIRLLLDLFGSVLGVQVISMAFFLLLFLFFL